MKIKTTFKSLVVAIVLGAVFYAGMEYGPVVKRFMRSAGISISDAPIIQSDPNINTKNY